MELYIVLLILMVLMFIGEVLTLSGIALSLGITFGLSSILFYFVSLNIWLSIAIIGIIGLFVTYFGLKYFRKIYKQNAPDINDY